MISTEQKTELWIIGTLIRLSNMGRIPGGIFLTGDLCEKLDNIDWWELDRDRLSWTEEPLFSCILDSILNNVPAMLRIFITTDVINFYNEFTRYRFLCSSYEVLYSGRQ